MIFTRRKVIVSCSMKSEEVKTMETKKKELDKILDCILDRAIVFFDNGDYMLSNSAFIEFYGEKANCIVGKNVFDVDDMCFMPIKKAALACQKSRAKNRIVFDNIKNLQKTLICGTPLSLEQGVNVIIIIEREIEPLNIAESMRETVSARNDSNQKHNKKMLSNDDDIIFDSKEMHETVSLAKKVANQMITVLLQGESGTGKEVLARYIHRNSERREGPFIKINCGAIPENLLESELFGYEKGAFSGASESGKVGLIEMANGGTLFLDEIADLPLQMQVKLLRVIQEKEVMRIGGRVYIPIDVRIITATNVDLKEAAEKSEFRMDLFYRLSVVPITIKPLRNRKKDIYPLTCVFLDKYNSIYGKTKVIDDSGWEILLKYEWPGNVRELENLIECLVVSIETDVINAFQIQSHFHDLGLENNCRRQTGVGLKGLVEKYERNIIISQLPYYRNTQALADAFKIDKSTLTRKMVRYGIRFRE